MEESEFYFKKQQKNQGNMSKKSKERSSERLSHTYKESLSFSTRKNRKATQNINFSTLPTYSSGIKVVTIYQNGIET